MKKFLTILVLVLTFLFLVAFPGLSALLTTSQLREDLVDYCQSTSPLVDRELEMYQLYQQGDSVSISKKAQVAGSDILRCRPRTKEVNRLYGRYLIIWDDWANDNVADLFGYGQEDNELIKYHEDVLELAEEVGVADKDLGSYSRSIWRNEKKAIIQMSKKYLLGTD